MLKPYKWAVLNWGYISKECIPNLFKKKGKMEELLFYIVDKNYIKYLSEFEKHVSYNKDEIGHSRPYLGIVLKIEGYNYFVPLYSYKEHYSKYKNNPSFFFVYDRKINH